MHSLAGSFYDYTISRHCSIQGNLCNMGKVGSKMFHNLLEVDGSLQLALQTDVQSTRSRRLASTCCTNRFEPTRSRSSLPRFDLLALQIEMMKIRRRKRCSAE